MPEEDRAFATRRARYGARNPVALERRTYDRTATAVTYRSDKSEGPTAGPETVDPLEFLARVLVYISDKGHVTHAGWVRFSDWNTTSVVKLQGNAMCWADVPNVQVLLRGLKIALPNAWWR